MADLPDGWSHRVIAAVYGVQEEIVSVADAARAEVEALVSRNLPGLKKLREVNDQVISGIVTSPAMGTWEDMLPRQPWEEPVHEPTDWERQIRRLKGREDG